MKTLIIIDEQNGFTTGSLKNPLNEAMVPKLLEALPWFREQGYSVIATRDTHRKDSYFESQEGKKLPVLHCQLATWDWELVDGLDEFVDRYVNKTSFGYDNWEDEFDTLDPEEIVIAGTVTSICVASNASILKSIFPETPIIILKDLCSDITEENHEAALKVMEAQQMDVMTFDEFRRSHEDI